MIKAIKAERKYIMADMQSKFEPRIWRRGVEYYNNGRVGPLMETDYGYRATVYGSETYTVDVFVESGEVADMDCDCPYAEEGEYCKHMAAVLIAMEKGEGEPKVLSLGEERAKRQEEFIHDDPAAYDIEMMVETADRDQLEQFLMSEMEGNPELARRFKVFTTDIISASELELYKEQLDDIFALCVDEDGYISYYIAEEMEDRLCDFAERVTEGTFVKFGRYDEAFMLTAHMLEKLSSMDMDDSGTGMAGITYMAENILKKTVTEGSDILRERIFEWIESKVGSDSYDRAGDVLRDIWQTSFIEPVYLRRKMKVIEKKLETADRYEMPSWIKEYYSVADAIGISQEEMEKMERKHWRVPEVREHVVDRLISGGRLKDAIKVLTESRKIDKNYSGLVCHHTKRLAEIYGMLGDDEKQRLELISLVTKHYGAGIDGFRELKACYSEEEWPSVRDTILEKIKDRPGIDEYYCEEQLYDRLLSLLQTKTKPYLVEKYADALKEIYPEETVALYETLIREEARFAGGRKHYKRIVKLLRKMKRLPKGREAAMRIADDLRVAYRRRSAMMDELDRL